MCKTCEGLIYHGRVQMQNYFLGNCLCMCMSFVAWSAKIILLCSLCGVFFSYHTQSPNQHL
uniref:LITAF domain-containing protein n=1 Tax=Anguilla anguilla TaxID=7936 RepID=A0A0E9SS22_ANGAN